MSTNVLLTTISTIAGLLPIIGFIITVISWGKQSKLNRENEIAKVRLKYRLELLTKTLNSLKEIYAIMIRNDPHNPPIQEEQNFVAKSIISISEDLYILGTKEEQQRWEFIKNDFFDNKNMSPEAFFTFAISIKDNYRRELGL